MYSYIFLPPVSSSIKRSEASLTFVWFSSLYSSSILTWAMCIRCLHSWVPANKSLISSAKRKEGKKNMCEFPFSKLMMLLVKETISVYFQMYCMQYLNNNFLIISFVGHHGNVPSLITASALYLFNVR